MQFPSFRPMESMDIPEVSLTIKYTYEVPSIHTVAKVSIHPCKPIDSIKIGNSFKQKNDTKFMHTMHIVIPTVRI